MGNIVRRSQYEIPRLQVPSSGCRGWVLGSGDPMSAGPATPNTPAYPWTAITPLESDRTIDFAV